MDDDLLDRLKEHAVCLNRYCGLPGSDPTDECFDDHPENVVVPWDDLEGVVDD